MMNKQTEPVMNDKNKKMINELKTNFPTKQDFLRRSNVDNSSPICYLIEPSNYVTSLRTKLL